MRRRDVDLSLRQYNLFPTLTSAWRPKREVKVMGGVTARQKGNPTDASTLIRRRQSDEVSGGKQTKKKGGGHVRERGMRWHSFGLPTRSVGAI